MRSVLITGASKGIGLETALTFGRSGYQVHATMRNPSRSPELAEIVVREKLPIAVSTMDVDLDHSVRDSIAAILRDHGSIDVLVNNAGVECSSSVEELPLAEFRAVMETNYFGPLRCIHALVPHMRERRSGCMINVSSVAGRFCAPPLTAYCASKWALEALSEGLAAEMKTFGVRVAIVEPGVIDTSMARRIRDNSDHSAYRHRARMAAVFDASLKSPVPPSLVARKILEVAESDTWQLRHPVGPDALPLLEWRRQYTDEQWVDLQASDDETYHRRMQADLGPGSRSAKN